MEIVSGEESSASDNRGGDGGLVFVSEEVVSGGTESPFESSGVFDGGGGVGFPLSSEGLENNDVRFNPHV